MSNSSKKINSQNQRKIIHVNLVISHGDSAYETNKKSTPNVQLINEQRAINGTIQVFEKMLRFYV